MLPCLSRGKAEPARSSSRAVLMNAARAAKPFVAVNCAAIPENLIESELFGHERGAFTGATAQRIGRFEECDGGTIFLDEIGDMALPTQTKILRVLQEGEIQRVGGRGVIKVNVRVIAATNRDLEAMVLERSFREDLYYRLNVVRLRLPALRERMEDLPLLVDFLLQKLTKTGKAPAKKVAPEAMALLQGHDWPGNVRELENALYRSAVMAKSDVILARDLPTELQGPPPRRVQPAEAHPSREEALEKFLPDTASVTPAQPEPAVDRFAAPEPVIGAGFPPLEPSNAPSGPPADLFDAVYERLRRDDAKDILAAAEKELVVRALKETGGNQVKASAILGMTRATLRKRIREHDLKF